MLSGKDGLTTHLLADVDNGMIEANNSTLIGYLSFGESQPMNQRGYSTVDCKRVDWPVLAAAMAGGVGCLAVDVV